jgi:hypothetical protein
VYSGRQKKLCANCGAWLGFASISKEGNGVVHLMMTIAQARAKRGNIAKEFAFAGVKLLNEVGGRL